MTASVIETVTGYNSAATTSVTAVFSEAPIAGELLIFRVAVANSGANYTPIPADGSVSTKVSSAGTLRHLATFWKIAGASEPTSYQFDTISGATSFVIAQRVSSSVGWAPDQSAGASNTAHEAATTNTVSAAITAAAGAYVAAFGYSTDNTAGNKQFNSGWSALTMAYIYRAAGVHKSSAGGTETATFSFNDATTNARLSVQIVEFLEAPSGPAITGGTPTGTTTDRTPTAGFSVDTESGAGYVVISQTAMPTITEEQIAAGTDDDDVALPGSQIFNAAISGPTFSAPQDSVSNLAAGTWYAYGVQDADDAGDYSNILAWTFTIPANPGLRVEDMYEPNADTLIGDATADCAVYDVLGGTELYQASVSISSAGFEIDSDLLGDVDDSVFCILRWDVIVGEDSEERVFGATLPVIDLGA
jgi:hypothetical protein